MCRTTVDSQLHNYYKNIVVIIILRTTCHITHSLLCCVYRRASLGTKIHIVKHLAGLSINKCYGGIHLSNKDHATQEKINTCLICYGLCIDARREEGRK